MNNFPSFLCLLNVLHCKSNPHLTQIVSSHCWCIFSIYSHFSLWSCLLHFFCVSNLICCALSQIIIMPCCWLLCCWWKWINKAKSYSVKCIQRILILAAIFPLKIIVIAILTLTVVINFVLPRWTLSYLINPCRVTLHCQYAHIIYEAHLFFGVELLSMSSSNNLGLCNDLLYCCKIFINICLKKTW